MGQGRGVACPRERSPQFLVEWRAHQVPGILALGVVSGFAQRPHIQAPLLPSPSSLLGRTLKPGLPGPPGQGRPSSKPCP